MVRRLLLISAILLAGCSGAPAPPEQPEGTEEVVDPWSGHETLTVLEGTAAWHASPVSLALIPYHPVFGDCIHNDGTVWAGQFNASERFAARPVLPGTKALIVTAGWQDLDYQGPTLQFLHRPPGGEGYGQQTLSRGTPETIRIPEDLDVAGEWDFWVCTGRMQLPASPPQPFEHRGYPFLGNLALKIEMSRAT